MYVIKDGSDWSGEKYYPGNTDEVVVDREAPYWKGSCIYPGDEDEGGNELDW
jgi:hypothetical protein